MTVKEVMKLIDAGYTKAEISEMMKPEKPAEPEETHETNEKKPETNETKNVKNTTEGYDFSEVMKEIQGIKKAIYAVNIMTSEQPETKSVDDILTNLIK
jgi:hypothetical protein